MSHYIYSITALINARGRGANFFELQIFGTRVN